SASHCGMARRLLERLGNRFIRALRAECEMPGALLRVDRDLCQPCMELPATPQADSGYDSRRQQRMREADAVAVQLDHTRHQGSVEAVAHLRRLGADSHKRRRCRL